MLARRSPVGEFEQRAADILVDHPTVVNNFCNAHESAERNKSGKATTEDLRQAMVHYRSLFEELLETTAAEPSNRSEQPKHESSEHGGPKSKPGFVDEPRRAVEQADALVAEVIKRLADGFAEERSKLEGQ